MTANLNGIRSAAQKGFFDWFGAQQADIVCVQEVRAQCGDIAPEYLKPHGYHSYFHFADKKGYSGVGVYARLWQSRVRCGRALPRSALRRVVGHFGVFSFRFEQRTSPGSEIPLYARLYATFDCTQTGARSHSLR